MRISDWSSDVCSSDLHRFHERCYHELFEKRGDKAMIFVSHDPGFVRERCERGSVLKDGVLHNFDDLEHAFHYYYSEAVSQPQQIIVDEDKSAEMDTSTQTLRMLLFGRSDEIGRANV